MTTATETPFSSVSIEEAARSKEEGERQRVRLRTELGIGAFGVSAVRSASAGAQIVPEHDEAGPGADGHEELYIVLVGHATFTIAGEETDAPQGTAVFEPYDAKDYAGALAVAKGVLHAYPGNGLALYNIACMEALLGKTDDALGHLAEAIEAAPRLRENAKTDDDFESLRGEKRFEELLAN